MDVLRVKGCQQWPCLDLLKGDWIREIVRNRRNRIQGMIDSTGLIMDMVYIEDEEVEVDTEGIEEMERVAKEAEGRINRMKDRRQRLKELIHQNY